MLFDKATPPSEICCCKGVETDAVDLLDSNHPFLQKPRSLVRQDLVRLTLSFLISNYGRKLSTLIEMAVTNRVMLADGIPRQFLLSSSLSIVNPRNNIF